MRLDKPLVWEGPYPNEAPTGFVSDGGSIPTAAWLLVGHPFSYSMLALYILHDYELNSGVEWLEAARRLRVRMRARGISIARRWAIGMSVTVYAWFKSRNLS